MRRIVPYVCMAAAVAVGFMYGFTCGEKKTERTDLVTVAVSGSGQALVTAYDGYGETIMQRTQSLDDPISTLFDF